MSFRADLVRAGLEALRDDKDVVPGPYEERMVRAIAAMLSVQKANKRPRVDESKLIVPPRTLFEAVRKGCPDKVLCEPIDARWFGRLGAALKALPSFTEADPQLLVDWLNAGGMSTWPQGVPTFSHLITHLDRWTAFAREWDQRGRQTIGGRRGSVGAPSTAESTDFSAFKVPKLT
jgi:hypothetical protein